MGSSDRLILVRLRAEVAQYQASMAAAAAATDDVGKKAALAAKGASDQIKVLESRAAKHAEAQKAVGTALLGFGVAAAAGVGLAVSKFTDFDAAMSAAQAGTNATGTALGQLRQAAIDGGAATQYSATEAAQAITEMGKAGVSTGDILTGGLKGALSLAAAGQLDVGRAGEIAATALNQFNLQGKDLPHVADLLAAGAGKAQGSVEDLANALKYVGPVANGLGVSIEETSGVLAEFASKGIIGEQAGTSFRGMLLALTSPSKLAANTMDDLGISVYDTSGNFVGMEGVAGALHDKLGTLDEATRNQALGQIFGNEQISAARVLYDGGAGAVAEWTKKVDDSGFAAKQAAALTDNLKGDIERLGGSFDTALIQSGSAANGALRDMVSTITDLVNGFGAMPAPLQKTALGLGAVAGAVGLVGGAALIGIPKVAAFKEQLALVAPAGSKAATALRGLSIAGGAIGAVLAIASVAYGIWAGKAAEAKARTDEYRDSLDQASGALTENTRKIAYNNLEQDGMIEKAKALGLNLDDVVTASIDPSSDAYTRLSESMTLARDHAKNLAETESFTTEGDAKAKKAGERFNFLTEILGAADSSGQDVKKSQAELADQMAAGVGPTDALTGAHQAGTDAISKQVEELNKLITAQSDAAGVVLSERDAQRRLADAVDAASKSLKDNGKTLDITTAKGRANQGALDDIASSGWKLIESMTANGASQKDLQGALGGTRKRFVDAATAMGLSGTEARKLADKLNLIPKNVTTKVSAPTAIPQKNVSDLHGLLLALPSPTVSVKADTSPAQKSLSAWVKANGATAVWLKPGLGITAATGGAIQGPGSGTSDDIPAWLSNGEHVLTADDVQKAGGQEGVYRLRTAIQQGDLRFAAGGAVGPSVTIPVNLDTSRLRVPDGAGAPAGGGAGGAGGSGSSLVAFGHLLQRMGFSVSEHPQFGGVHPVHMKGSKHYQGRAIDVNHGAGTSAAEQAALDGVIPLSRKYGLGHIWRQAGHFNHAHFQYATGGAVRAPIKASSGGAAFASSNAQRFAVGGQVNVFNQNAAPSVREAPLVHVERVVQGTPQDVGAEVAWALAGRRA